MTIAIIGLVGLIAGIGCLVAWKKSLVTKGIDDSEAIETVELPKTNTMQNIYEFNDKHVSDIVIHRKDMCVLALEASFEEVMEIVMNHPFNRFPIYKEDIDEIVGIIHAKDILTYLYTNKKPKTFHLKDIMHEAYFILVSQRVDHAFKDMQEQSIPMAIVLDEYGGTEGLITTEDMVGEMVNDLFYEEDGYVLNKISFIQQLAGNRYRIDASSRLYELEGILGTAFPVGEFDTLSGFIINQLGYIPGNHEKPTIYYKNILFELTDISSKRINTVIATIFDEDVTYINQFHKQPS